MSLINDALKQARQAQAGGASAAGPALEPAETRRGLPGGAELWVAILLVLVPSLAAVLFWQWYHAGGGGKPNIAAVTPAPQAAAVPTVASPTVAAAPVVAKPVVEAKPAAIAPTPAVVAEPAPVVVAPVEPPKPAAPVYKLQSVFYSPKNPSAIISGKDVFVGSQVGDRRVVAIGPRTVMLVSASGEKSKLELP